LTFRPLIGVKLDTETTQSGGLLID